jgi:ureidoglycolate lyase
MTTLEPRALTAEAFAAFGKVISTGLTAGQSANQGTAVRFNRCVDFENTRAAATPNLAVFRVQPRSLPLEVAVLERHLHSTQVFLPLAVTRYLVCVAPTLGNGGPDVSRLEAFIGVAGQGVAYAAGTWHHPMVALDAPGEFAMLAWEDGSALDCELRALSATVTVGPGSVRSLL